MREMYRENHHCIICAAVMAAVLVSGCGSDNDPVDPGASGVGTVVIDLIPEQQGASWGLYMLGPTWSVLASGSGDTVLVGMPSGLYRTVWGHWGGWVNPPNMVLELVNGTTITFSGIYSAPLEPIIESVLIPPASVSVPATFTMGDTVEAHYDETPHQVTLTRRFFMATTEVTNGDFLEVAQWAYDQGYLLVSSRDVCWFSPLGYGAALANIRCADTPDAPLVFDRVAEKFSTDEPDAAMSYVYWYGAAAFCDWLSIREGLPPAYNTLQSETPWSCNDGMPYDAPGYRLPTEAEWEFACRAGTVTPFYTGICLDSATEANYVGISPYLECPSGPYLGQVAVVASYTANDWGLFDMHGNVWEWVNGVQEYSGDQTDPIGRESGYGILRGGSYKSPAHLCRSARRNPFPPIPYTLPRTDRGFRPVRSLN